MDVWFNCAAGCCINASRNSRAGNCVAIIAACRDNRRPWSPGHRSSQVSIPLRDDTKALQSPPGYAALLKDIKERVRTAQMRAALAVNRELILLYWSIGRDILVRQQAEGWGTKVIERLAKDLGAEFPGVEGFSPRSLKYMRTFAREWPDESIAQQVAGQLPWGHHMSSSTGSRIAPRGNGICNRPLNMAGAAMSSFIRFRGDCMSVKAKPSRISPERFRPKAQIWRNRFSRTLINLTS